MNTTAGGPATGTSSLRTLTLRTISVPYPRRLCYHVKQRTGRMRCQADDAGAESSGDQGIQGTQEDMQYREKPYPLQIYFS